MYLLRLILLIGTTGLLSGVSPSDKRKGSFLPSRNTMTGNACKLLSPPEPIHIRGLDQKATVLAIGKLAGSQRDELVTGYDSLVRVYKINNDSAHLLFSIVVVGRIQQMTIGDADNDGNNELLVATGKSDNRDSMGIRLFVISDKGNGWQAMQLYFRKSERPEPTFLGLANLKDNRRKDIVLSYFESKYNVETVVINVKNSGSVQATVLERKRMAMARDVGMLPGRKEVSIVVGRPYGDSIGAKGDAYIKGTRDLALPAYRGVKAVKIGDIDGDGKNEIFLGDGWHQDYGKIARGRIAMLSYSDTGYRYKLIEDVKGQYETSQIAIADLNGDSKNELLVRGNKFFKIYKYATDGWKVFTDVNIPSAPFALGDVNGDGLTDVVFAGREKIEIYDFRNVEYSSDLGRELFTKEIDPSSLVGFKAPELVINKWYNKDISGIAKLKGKVVVIDFWATWCRPCIKMFPILRSWQEKYADQGLVILGLTKLDDNQDLKKIEDFVAKQSFPYPIGISEEANNNLAYGVTGIPHMVLIDKQGYIRRFETGSSGVSDFEMDLQKYLQQ